MNEEPFAPYGLFGRALFFGADYGDLTRAASGASNWEEWAQALAAAGRDYRRAAAEAAAAGRIASAVEWSQRATASFHFAQLRLSSGDLKRSLAADVRRTFNGLAPRLEPPATRFEARLEGRPPIPGWLREVRVGAPLVVLFGGLDSAKEVELSAFGELFLRRGLSVCFLDLPGQGELADAGPMPLDVGAIVGSVLDALLARGEQPAAFGLFGVSFGGHLACRAFVEEGRFASCVCLGGFFDGLPLSALPSRARAAVRRAFRLAPDSNLGDLASHLALDALSSHPDRPLLIVHGERDQVVERDQAEALRNWGGPRAELWIIEGAEHVCTDRFASCLPRIGDWTAKHLTEAVGCREPIHATAAR